MKTIWIDEQNVQKVGGLLTGSRAFGVATEDSDTDYLVNAEQAQRLGLCSGSNEGEYGDDYDAFRYGNLNIIVAWTEEAYNKWLLAHEHCMKEKPKAKSERKRIFRHYVDGEPLTGADVALHQDMQ